ncbi:hypothetical protein [Nonomuraea sp. NPDC049504]|uniref:hypothetical protein n=1 Tax=Nonomuraea sp. NPDC049504 TaxID=3154729 RepID=UPI003446F750
MNTRRQRAADAAIEVIAEQGLRGLTHRAADARAGCRRQHDQLLPYTAVAARRRPGTPAGAGRARGHPAPTRRLEHQGPGRRHPDRPDQALARPGQDPHPRPHAAPPDAGDGALLRAELDAASERFARMAEEGLGAGGVPDAGRAARTLVAQLDGVLFDALARPSPEEEEEEPGSTIIMRAIR